MKKVAIVFDLQSPRMNYIKKVLNGDYDIVETHNYEDTMELLEKSLDYLSILILDNPSSKKHVKEVLEYIKKRNGYLFSLPVLVLTDPEHMRGDDEFLGLPVVGILSTSDTEKVVSTRIANSIKLANSTGFDDFADMLKVLPSLIYLKDVRGRYAFCSQRWHHLHQDLKTIRGLTDFEIRKNQENARIARETDLEVLRSGVGKRYTIKESDDEGTEYFQIIKEPIQGENGEPQGIIAIINNVTTEELLRQELREKSITDQLTGLYNRAYFEELTHWQSQDLKFPLTIISADCDNLKQINDKFGHSAGDQYIRYAGEAIREVLPEEAFLFRMGGDEFLAIVPETTKEEGIHLVNKINKNAKKYKNDKFSLKLSVGSFTIIKHEDSIESAVILSDKEMYKVKKSHKTSKK